MTDEQRAALGRLRTSLGLSGDQYMDDLETVSDLYLAEHPADDEEPVTEDWLRSVGAIDDPAPPGSTALEMHLDFTIGCRTHQMRFTRDPFTKKIGSWSLLPSVGEGRIWPERPMTRGRVRELFRAITGVPLQETAT